MTDEENTPNTAQITMWRNLLDAFGQLSAAWAAAHDAQKGAEAGEGPGTLTMPSDLIVAFTRAGEGGAEALSGLATVLARLQVGAPSRRPRRVRRSGAHPRRH